MNACGRLISQGEAGSDPVLDPAPIHRAAPPVDRSRVALAFLGCCLVLVLAYQALPHLLPPPVQRQPLLFGEASGGRTTVDLLLPEPPPPPAPGLLGRPGGGNGAVDPALLGKTVSDITTLAEPPEDLSELVLPTTAAYYADLTLPVLKGGDGRRVGKGEGGGQQGVPPPAGFDRKLVLVKKVLARCGLPPDGSRDVPDVAVRIVVEDSGRVSKATILSGPPYAHASVIAAALQWEFEPLAAHGLRGPLATIIYFKPVVLTS